MWFIADRSLTLEQIAEPEGGAPSYATRLFRLRLLALEIVSAILLPLTSHQERL
jgi:hypothetical protein